MNIDRLLRIFAFDWCDSLFWRGSEGATDGELRFFVFCSDVFAWGGSDVEPIESDADLDALEQAKADAPPDTHHWPELYCARRRGQRPQGALYQYFTADEKELFDACGPERVVGFGNPLENVIAKT